MNFEYYFRKATSRFRTLPDFVIVGAQKGGTTSLFEYLNEHPGVFRNNFKELHFFNKRSKESLLNYRFYFPLNATKLIRPGVLAGEASPDYMFFKEVAQQLKEAVPKAKIIILLREPISRAISHYRHNQRMGREGLSFKEAIEFEDLRIQKDYFNLRTAHRTLIQDYSHYSYRLKGEYHWQVKEYLDVFPRDQVLIIQSEKLFGHPDESFNKCLKFLGLDPMTLPSYKVWNQGGTTHNFEGIDHATIEKLKLFYQPHNESLYELIQERFDWEY